MIRLITLSNNDSSQATAEYIEFVQRHYVPFLEDAVRCMFLCGFVPWRIRKLPNGAVVPETMPIGTFTWSSESNHRPKPMRNYMGMATEKKPRVSQKNSAALSYNIRFIHPMGISEKDVHIYQYLKPVMQHGASLHSPLSGIVLEYRNIYRAMARTEYADEWNTQAKLICSYTSVNNMYNMNEGNPITNDWSVPQNRSGMLSDSNIPTELEQNVYVRDAVMERVVQSKLAAHTPTVYSMPKNSKLETVAPLQSNMDISTMQFNTARNIASILGVPFEIVGGGYSSKQGGNKSLENNRIFIANMTSMCTHLQFLLQDVYSASFPQSKTPVSFRLRASPRLEVTTIQELLLLIDSGLLTTENAFAMSNMILGIDLKHAGGVLTEKYQASKQFVPLSMQKQRNDTQ
jgi:hypothetical protein